MLETNRLFLRRMTNADVENVFAMRSDKDVMQFIRPIQTKKSETECWIKLVSSRWEKEKIGFCAIIEKSTKNFAGWCGLWRLKETGETEVGYALLKEFWGKGYAVEASEAFLQYGFEELNIEKIVAVADPENRNSRRVMEKIGMKFDFIDEFYERNLVHYSILREVFLTQRRSDAKDAK